MKKSFVIILLISFSFFLFSCRKEEKKPFGATDYSYDGLEGINNNGPVLDTDHPENTPPFSDKVLIENGPKLDDSIKEINTPPTADKDIFARFDDVPIYEPEHKD